MIEKHPFDPFIPKTAETLILGSFPPPEFRQNKNRSASSVSAGALSTESGTRGQAARSWCMNFFYPNLRNDFWRIFGLIFFNDVNFFLIPEADPRGERGVRVFDESKIRRFWAERGLAVYDAAVEVVRTTASDADLKVVRALDLTQMVRSLPCCHRIVFTGQKAAETLWPQIAPDEGVSKIPRSGQSRSMTVAGRTIDIARVCSSSRAYPLAIEKKAAIYRAIFITEKHIDS